MRKFRPDSKRILLPLMAADSVLAPPQAAHPIKRAGSTDPDKLTVPRFAKRRKASD